MMRCCECKEHFPDNKIRCILGQWVCYKCYLPFYQNKNDVGVELHAFETGG